MDPHTEEAIERQADALERLADATEVQNALLLEVVHQLEHDRAQRHPDHEKRPTSDAGVASGVVDAYCDLYGGSLVGGNWEFEPIAQRVEDMGEE